MGFFFIVTSFCVIFTKERRSNSYLIHQAEMNDKDMISLITGGLVVLTTGHLTKGNPNLWVG